MNSTLVMYVPVLHEGYLALFRKYGGVLYLVGPDMVEEELPRLHRDLRQMPIGDTRHAIVGLQLFDAVHILTPEYAEKIDSEHAPIVMPVDEISDVLAARYFPHCKVTKVNKFLRWDKPITEAEQQVSPDRIVSSDEADKEFMQAAGEEAVQSGDWWRQIGAVAVRDGEVLFTAHNKHYPSEHTVYAVGNPRDNFDAGERPDISPSGHAEATIVGQAAGSETSLHGASMYVTTFPCINCARLLVEAGVAKVYYRSGYSRQDAEGELKDKQIEIILVQDAV